MKRFTHVKSGGVILTLLLLALVSGSVWGQVGTLPIKQSGGKSELPKGFSYEGLGSDYSAEPKLKFDDTGDYLVLHFDNTPQNLSYTIKWNGSGTFGVFTVEESADGTNYNELVNYTNSNNPGANKSKDEKLTLSSDTRYVRWIYNSKKTGNVGIGNIIVTEALQDDKVNIPILTPEDGTTFVDKLTVTVSCSTEGATIYYTKNGAEPTTSSDKFPTEGVTLTETTTLKAIAVKDGLDNSEIVTATYTKLEPYASLKALKESGIATTEGVTCFVELKDAVVTYADSRKAYIQDETAGLYVFGSNNLKAGTKLDGLVSAKLALYFGLYELKVDGGEFDNVAVTNDVEIPVQEVTVAELNQNFARYESMRVKVVDATVTSSFNDKNGEIEQNGEKIALRAADENITADVQATVDVTGYPGLYNSTKQLNVILQEDIAVKTAGKTQATLTFDSDTYSVNVGEFLTVKATTNSSASVIYSSSDKTIATVDENTGEVQAGNKVGTVTITATVTENDEYTGATATCTMNVVDPSALPEAKALVAEDKEGILHAMKNELGNTRLNAMEVYSLNGKIIDEGKADIKWYIDIDNGTIQNMDGMYVVFEDANDSDIKLSSKKGNSWYYKSEDGSWNTKETDGRFLGYKFNTLKNICLIN